MGEPGDVVFILQEKKHPVFKRKHADLLLQKDVTLMGALCGYEFIVNHLDGRQILVKSKPGEIVRPESSPGEPFCKCVEGEGMPIKGTGGYEKGKLFIYFRIVFPREGQLSAPTDSYDPETVEEYTTDVTDLREFGKVKGNASN